MELWAWLTLIGWGIATAVSGESLGGGPGGGYYIKAFGMPSICPLHHFCLPWDNKGREVPFYNIKPILRGLQNKAPCDWSL